MYPNLAVRLVVDGLKQLWVADITYIWLREQFIYLAVILDAFSRRVIGWQLGESLEAKLAVAALEQALRERQLEAGWCITPIAACSTAAESMSWRRGAF